MTDLQTWFEPLLWIMGTLTVCVAFIRLCRPIWKIVTHPSEAEGELKKINLKLDAIESKLTELDARNTKEENIELSLLHDSIVQIYNNAKNTGVLHSSEYQRACALYKENGKSEYIDSIMKLMEDMFTEQNKQK